MCKAATSTALAACLLLAAAGCGRNPFLTQTVPYGAPAYAWQAPAGGAAAVTPDQLAQYGDVQRRAGRLDADNTDLHRQLAQSQQQMQVLNDQVGLLQKQLGETAAQARELQQQRDASEKKLEAALASARQRGGATLTANNSLTRKLEAVELPGLLVRQDGDLVRIEIPADRVFRQGSAQLLPSGPPLLAQVGDAVARHYPRQRVVVEGHAAASPSSGTFLTSDHQLSAAQAMAVLDQLAATGRIPMSQLTAMALGGNHPLESNQTPGGRARNRRVEVVIYPEQVGGQP